MLKFSFTTLLIIGSIVSKGSSQNCPVPNGYFADNGGCDSYLECREGQLSRQKCPDGLVYNDRLTEFPRYPCSYPGEVDCGSRPFTQVRSNGGDCPRQYGLFSTGNKNDCSGYINCVGGKPYFQSCPEGLAFNELTARCQWPDEVPGCKVPSIRFQCPGVRVEADLGHPRYADSDDCRKFYVCIENTVPRMHSCGVPYVFNPELGVCDEPKNVPRCANFYPADILDALQKLRSFDNSIA